MPGDQIPHSVLPLTESGQVNIMQVTYAQLFKFMGTFTNQELDDAQTIAEHAHQGLGKSYNQVLVDVLVEMRQHQLAN